MNPSAPDAPQPGAQSDGAVMRFLRWLIEPPVGPQAGGLRVLRWLFRTVAFLFYCFCAGEAGGLDGAGNAGVGRKGGKPGKPPA